MRQSYTTIFKRDPSYQGPHIVQTYLKKEKSNNSYKIFGDHTTRFFTLNMQTFEFYYTPRDQYQAKDIKDMDIANIKYIVDRGCESNTKGQNKEWTFQILIYYTTKYTILYCQNQIMKNLWLEAFKAIIRISDHKSLLHDFKNPLKEDEVFKVNNKVLSHINLNDSPANKNAPSQQGSVQNSTNQHKESNTNKSIDRKQSEKELKQADEQKETLKSANNSRRNSNESVGSNDSLSKRKKNRTAFNETQKKPVTSNYKKKSKFDAFWNQRVVPKFKETLLRVRRKLATKSERKTQSTATNPTPTIFENSKTAVKKEEQLESNTQQKKKQVEVQIEQNENNVEIENLEFQNSPIGKSGLQDSPQIFQHNDDRHSHKKLLKQNQQIKESSMKKHHNNIFYDISSNQDMDNEEIQPSLNIQFQQKKSQNGWDGEDIDILQTILRENSNQLKENQQEDKGSSQSNIPQKNTQKEDFLSYGAKKQDDIPEVEVIHPLKPVIKKQASGKGHLAMEDYEDWDTELDNVVTPSIQNKKALYQNTNSHPINQKQDNFSTNPHKFNQYINNNNNISSTQQPVKNQSKISEPTISQPQKQVGIIDNDYDDWDDEM